MHGDCKPSQFLIGDGRVYLLDLDHCGVSDQAADVGTFLATLRQQEIRDDLAGGRPAARTSAARVRCSPARTSTTAPATGTWPASSGRRRWRWSARPFGPSPVRPIPRWRGR